MAWEYAVRPQVAPASSAIRADDGGGLSSCVRLKTGSLWPVDMVVVELETFLSVGRCA